jgi:hypothetical protein
VSGLTGARARGRPETPSVARTTFLAITKQRSRTRRLCARACTVPCAGRCYSRRDACQAACCGTRGGCHSSEPGVLGFVLINSHAHAFFLELKGLALVPLLKPYFYTCICISTSL